MNQIIIRLEKSFQMKLEEKEIDFHTDLAKAGMRFGGRMALAVGLFTIGVTILLTTVDLYVQNVNT